MLSRAFDFSSCSSCGGGFGVGGFGMIEADAELTLFVGSLTKICTVPKPKRVGILENKTKVFKGAT